MGGCRLRHREPYCLHVRTSVPDAIRSARAGRPLRHRSLLRRTGVCVHVCTYCILSVLPTPAVSVSHATRGPTADRRRRAAGQSESRGRELGREPSGARLRWRVRCGCGVRIVLESHNLELALGYRRDYLRASRDATYKRARLRWRVRCGCGVRSVLVNPTT